MFENRLEKKVTPSFEVFDSFHCQTRSTNRFYPCGAGLSRPRHAHQCTSRNSALTSHVARVVAMDPCPRCVVWGRGVVLFFCAALNKRPSLCGVSWWSAGFAQGGASANLVW